MKTRNGVAHIFLREKKQQMNGGSRRLNSHSGRKIKMDLAVCSRYSAMASFISFWLLLCSSHNIHRWNRGMNVWCTRDSGLYTHLSVYVSEGLGMPRSSINIALWMKRREKERERAKMQEKEKKEPIQRKSLTTHMTTNGRKIVDNCVTSSIREPRRTSSNIVHISFPCIQHMSVCVCVCVVAEWRERERVQ